MRERVELSVSLSLVSGHTELEECVWGACEDYVRSVKQLKVK